MKIVGLIFVFLVSFNPAQAIEIPNGLSKADLSNVIQLLGLNTSNKILSNPFPLGGYSGFEIGINYEIVNTSDLSSLGNTAASRDSFKYLKITVGKGIYNDLDVYVNFIPFNEQDAITEYGGLIRWGFYQAKILPISFALIGHGNMINFNDQFIHETFGVELVTGINVNDFSLYFGGGKIEGEGRFISSILNTSDPNITLDSKNTFEQSVLQTHTFVGASVHFNVFFLAAQIDRYERPVYSAKVGMRF